MTDEAELRRQLNLELVRLRAEASAARLEAQAARVEQTLQRLSHTAPPSSVNATHPPAPTAHGFGSSPTAHRFHSYTEITRARHTAAEVSPAAPALHHAVLNQAVPDAAVTDGLRIDPAHIVPTHEGPKSHEVVLNAEADLHSVQADVPGAEASTVIPNAPDDLHDVPVEDRENDIAIGNPKDDLKIESSVVDSGPDVRTNDEPQHHRRRKSPLVVSALVHVAVVIGLGLVALETHSPGDAIALTASPVSDEATEIQTVQIETASLSDDVSEPVEAVQPVSLDSVLGQGLPPTPPTTLTGPTPILETSLDRLDSSAMSRRMSAASSDSISEFCGVKGGGNHFVYLVDSSGSMGDAFATARRELLRAIDGLKPEQRFYVIFFDAESDYMRLSDPDADETQSVRASQENKAALRRWAMSIRMDRGQHPADELEFALGLRPDVVFLLSDGEFPERIETLLKEKNRIENLFGDVKPVSIVHTIGYHSREGEQRMRRIATGNGGQYRHVPKPD